MEAFPDAALALSSNVIDPESPYPIVLHPKELFAKHYLGRSPLGVGPSAAIIRRDRFNEVGGFSEEQFIGDTELWLKLGEQWPVVALPPALVWWRRHSGQQMALEQRKPEVLNLRHALELRVLSATSNLTEDEKRRARGFLNRLHARRILSLGLKRVQFRAAWSLFRASGLSLRELLQGLRKPVRPLLPSNSEQG